MHHNKQGRLSKVEEYVENLKIEDRSSQGYRVVFARIETDLQKLIKQSVKDKGNICSSMSNLLYSSSILQRLGKFYPRIYLEMIIRDRNDDH